MLDKNTQQPRFGSDWDLDLGWVLTWWGLFLAIVGVFVALAYASVQNNRGNIARDNYYAQHCKVISRGSQNTLGVTYQCQN